MRSIGPSKFCALPRHFLFTDRQRSGAKLQSERACSAVPRSIISGAIFVPHRQPGKVRGAKAISKHQTKFPVQRGDEADLPLQVLLQCNDKPAVRRRKWTPQIPPSMGLGIDKGPLKWLVRRKQAGSVVPKRPCPAFALPRRRCCTTRHSPAARLRSHVVATEFLAEYREGCEPVPARAPRIRPA